MLVALLWCEDLTRSWGLPGKRLLSALLAWDLSEIKEESNSKEK